MDAQLSVAQRIFRFAARFEPIAWLSFPARMLLRGYGRYLPAWLASLRPAMAQRSPQPWLVFSATEYLETFPLAGKQVFEYGSGASTQYWLRRRARVISIEHDAAWYQQVRRRIPAAAGLDYRFVAPEPDSADAPPRDPAEPADCVSAHYPQDRLRYSAYVAQIDALPDRSLDLVLVDGRARAACLVRAAPKVRPGGLLILDNSDRGYYTARVGAALSRYEALIFRGPAPQAPIFSQTTIYRCIA
ncbi:MAG: hypothetical protein HC822_17950 [Oscillochloris sp.]|nr:hypothetical protein [Oscillochloris sp.]